MGGRNKTKQNARQAFARARGIPASTASPLRPPLGFRDGSTKSSAAPPSPFPQQRSPGHGENIQGGKRPGNEATALGGLGSAPRSAPSLPPRPRSALFPRTPPRPRGRCSPAAGRKPPSKPLSALTDSNSGPTRIDCQVCVFPGGALSPNATCRPFFPERTNVSATTDLNSA